jgi:hypothetical protein
MLRFVKSTLPYLAVLAVGLGMLNFFWFFAESVSLGTAASGRVVDGHYFLGNHGMYTEVSRDAWEWSRFHSASTFVTHLMMMASMAYLLFRFGFPGLMGSLDVAANEAAAEAIRASGAPLATGRTAGRIGGVNLAGPLLNVAVYPAGIIAKPIFMPERAIPMAAIDDVSTERSVIGNRIVIRHSLTGSPFIVFGDPDDPLASAILGLAKADADSPTRADRPESRPLPPAAAPWPFRFGVSAIRKWEDDGARAFEAFPPHVGEALFLIGMVVTGAMLAVGVTYAIPKLGVFGVIWIAILLMITVYNVRVFLRRR